MIELKHCPFCGREIEVYTVEAKHGTVMKLNITCTRCGTEFELKSTIIYVENRIREVSSALDTWNNRA